MHLLRRSRVAPTGLIYRGGPFTHGGYAPAYAVSPLQGLFLIAQEIADQVRDEEIKSGMREARPR